MYFMTVRTLRTLYVYATVQLTLILLLFC